MQAKVFPETRCIVYVLNIATYFITRWSTIKFRTFFYSIFAIARHVYGVTMMSFVFAPATGWPNRYFKTSYSPIRSSIQNIFKFVLLYPKGNIDYFLDCLKLTKLQWVKENSVVLFRKRSSLNFNQCLQWIWIYIPLEEGYLPDDTRCMSGSFSVLISKFLPIIISCSFLIF